MKTIEQFKDYCMREIDSDLVILEKIRSSVHRKLLAAAALLACAGMGLLFFMQQQGYIAGIKAALIAAGCILFVVLVILGLLPKVLMRECCSAYKMSVIDKLIKFLDPNLQYDAFDFVSGGIYSMANIFRRQAERYSGSDLAKGRLGDIPLEFSRVHSEYYHKGGKSSRWVTIFKGLFFVADCNKNFSGQTIVLPDVAQNLLGNVGLKLQFMMPPVGQLVKLDDAEFEKHFVVYSENEIDARTILSPALMQRVVDFRKKNRSIILTAFFHGSQVFVALSLERNFCEPSLFGPIINFAKIDQYLEYISLAVGIVEEVNRNTGTATPKEIKEIDIGLGATALL